MERGAILGVYSLSLIANISFSRSEGEEPEQGKAMRPF